MVNFLFDILLVCDKRDSYQFILDRLKGFYFNFISFDSGNTKRGFIVIEENENFYENKKDYIVFVKDGIEHNYKNVIIFSNIQEVIDKIFQELDKIKPIEKIEFDIDELEQAVSNKLAFVKQNYVNRKEEKSIKELISNDESFSIISISGLGGVGKTYLIGKVILDLLDKYNFFIFEILNESSLEDLLYYSMFRFIRKINNKSIELKDVMKFKELIIDNLDYSNLDKFYIVIDSAERNFEVSNKLIGLFNKYPKIITSREIFFDNEKNIILRGMEEEAAKELLKKLNEKLYSNLEKENKLDYVLEKVDYIPLAITLIAAFNNVDTLDKVLSNIAINSSVREIVENIFSYHYKRLNKKEKVVLQSIAIIPNVDKVAIKEILEKFFEEKNLDKLECTLNKLKKMNFIKDTNNTFYIHPLLREYLMYLLSLEMLEEKIVLRYKVLSVLLDFYNGEEKEKFVLFHLKEIEEVVMNVSKSRAEIIIRDIENILYKNGYFYILKKFYEKIKDNIHLADILVRTNSEKDGIEILYREIKNNDFRNKEFYVYLYFASIYSYLEIETLKKLIIYIQYKLNYFYNSNEIFYFSIFYSLESGILEYFGIEDYKKFEYSKLLLNVYNEEIVSNFFLAIYNILMSNLSQGNSKNILDIVNYFIEEFDLENREIDFFKLKALCEILLNKNVEKSLEKIKDLERKMGISSVSKFIEDFDKFTKGEVKKINISNYNSYSYFYKIILALKGDDVTSNSLYEKIILESIRDKNKKYISGKNYIEEILLNVYAKEWEIKDDLDNKYENYKKFLKDFVKCKKVSYPFKKENLYILKKNKEKISREEILQKLIELGIDIEFYSYYMKLDKINFDEAYVNEIELEALASEVNVDDELVGIISKSYTFKYSEEKEILYKFLQTNKNQKIIKKLRLEANENKYDNFERNLFLAKNSNEFIFEKNNKWYIKFYKTLNENDLINICFKEFKGYRND